MEKEDTRLNRVFVRLDDKIDYIEVRLYGLLDFISNLGGLSSFLYEAGLILARFLAYDLFIANLMKLLFTIQTIQPRGSDDASNHDSDHHSKKDRKLKKTTYAGIDINQQQKQKIIEETTMKEAKKEKNNFKKLEKKIEAG